MPAGEERVVQNNSESPRGEEPVMGRSPQNVPPDPWQGSQCIWSNSLCVSSRGKLANIANFEIGKYYNY